MRFSWGMTVENAFDKNGFGYAGKKVVQSLRRLGHDVEFLDATAPVEIWFAHPNQVKWSGAGYRIMYVPWESTEFQSGWVDAMNESDEVWTPSPIVAQWMREAGVKVPVRAYEHGVDLMWRQRLRILDGTINVFHHGGEALRKGFTETAEIFRQVFFDHDSLMTFKMQSGGWAVPLPKMRFVTEMLPVDELVDLYHKQHIMIYPSWGEGFGLTPLQAMATGMPVLITKGWAPYEHLLPPECLIESTLVESPWQKQHPGKMFKPDLDDAIDKARDMHLHYDYQASWAYDIALKVREEYDWESKTELAFSHIINSKKNS